MTANFEEEFVCISRGEENRCDRCHPEDMEVCEFHKRVQEDTKTAAEVKKMNQDIQKIESLDDAIRTLKTNIANGPNPERATMALRYVVDELNNGGLPDEDLDIKFEPKESWTVTARLVEAPFEPKFFFDDDLDDIE